MNVAIHQLFGKDDHREQPAARGLSLASLNRTENACKDFKKLATINPSAGKQYLEQYAEGNSVSKKLATW